MPSICLLTPIKDSVPGPAYTSAVDFAIDYTRRGGELALKTTWLSSNLAKARMTLVRQALESGAERVLFVDDDIVYSPNDVRTLLERTEDVVSGAYHRREPDGAAIGFPLVNGERRGSLIEMQFIGLGFALVSRTALLRLVATYGDALFEFRKGRGEDEAFSNAWRALGECIWLHTGVRLGHVGPTIFRGPQHPTTKVTS